MNDMELFRLAGTICYLEWDRLLDIEIKLSFGYGDCKTARLSLYIPKINWCNPDDLPF